jgi:hypothetical protein
VRASEYPEEVDMKVMSDHEVREMQSNLINFVSQGEFRKIIGEIYELREDLRHEFVDAVLLDRDLLSKRGIKIPDDLYIQRSHFADERPTLFCVVKKLPEGYGWKKITVTFDNEKIGLERPAFAFDDHGNPHWN